MLIDLKKINEPLKLQCDLCIVGTGAAGLSLATALSNTPLNILLLEAGGLKDEAQTQALYDVEISGLPHPGATEGRFRTHGGSTTRWGGQTLPLMPIDFEKREWVPYSGWPITDDELKPYYQRATQFLLVDQKNFDSDLLIHLDATPPAFNTSELYYHFSKWSPTPNVRENHFANIKASSHCTLLLHANVTKIICNENKTHVQQIEARSLTGQHATIIAKNVVLCTGGIETARLLLVNHIGNDHDLVGRFFQDHPSAFIGWLNTTNPKQVQKLFSQFHKQRLKYSVRCTAAQAWQREKRVLNISSGIHFIEENPIYQNTKEIYQDLRDLRFSGATLRKIRQSIRHPFKIASPITQYLLKGRSYVPDARFQIGVTTEQEPNPNSRITLSERRDALGMPLSNLNWQLTALTHYSIQQFAINLCDAFHHANIGEIILEPWVLDNANASQESITDQFHHIGTARMHDSPSHGVVDRDCRVHGFDNLYIGSSAVFPTSGHSNPTFTIIALCMRLADKLRGGQYVRQI